MSPRRALLLFFSCSALVLGTTSCAAPTPAVSGAGLVSTPASASDGQLTRAGCSVIATGSSAHTNAQLPAAGPVVLTVTGRFTTGAQSPRQLDMVSLNAMTQVECSVDDRLAEGHQVTFRGVLLSTLLASIGADPSSTLHTNALNDYAVDLPVSDIRDLPVLLATTADGAPMSVAHYGPLRIIYPTAGFNLDPTIYDPRRIWQVSSIDVQ
jgi:hypothetical protein